jgi:PAS domain S-box-containing protein
MLHVEEHVDAHDEQAAAVFLAATLASLRDSLITLDLQGIITTWNHSAELLHGYSAAEVVGKSLTLLTLKQDQPKLLDAIQRAGRGEYVPIFETERIHKDGTHMLMSVQVSPIRNEEGRTIGISTLARDRTREIKWREAMRESEMKFRLLTENIPQLVWTCTPEGECDYVSPQWCEYTGAPVEQQLGRGWAQWVHPDDREPMHQQWRAAVKCESSFELEYRLRNQGGEYRWFQIRGVPVRDDLGTIVKWFGTCTDVQVRKQAEMELEKLVTERTAELHEAMKQMETFSYSLAHDMRAPLRAMSSFSQILQDRYGSCLDTDGREIVERIRTAAARLDLLIVDVLRYTRVLRQPAPVSPLDLDELVAEIIATSHGWSPPRADVRIEGKLPRVIGHAGFLGQCVSNLVENAIKFVTPGVQPKVRISGESDGQVARLYVRDNGIGIAPEDQKRMFQIFERLRPAEEYEGTGIGLAIVRTAAERMGGRVGLESEFGKGSTFWIELSAAPAN